MRWAVPKGAWTGETCVILAGGPSLRGADLALLRPGADRRPRVITINDSWRLAPWADVLYFCDAKWLRGQLERCQGHRSAGDPIPFQELLAKGFWVSGAREMITHRQVRYLELTEQLGLEPDPAKLRHGSNGGYQAMGIAAHYGVRRIVLLGYDMHCDSGRTHWHDEPRPSEWRTPDKPVHHFLPCFDYIAGPLAERGIEVINATPFSALKLWPYLPLEQALAAAEVPCLS